LQSAKHDVIAGRLTTEWKPVICYTLKLSYFQYLLKVHFVFSTEIFEKRKKCV